MNLSNKKTISGLVIHDPQSFRKRHYPGDRAGGSTNAVLHLLAMADRESA